MTDRIMPVRRFYGEAVNSFVHFLNSKPSRAPIGQERVLGPFILPPFQRPLVWTEAQKIALIESIYMGLPIGSIVWNRSKIASETDEWLLDGQQRASAIIGYMNNDFCVNGYFFGELPAIENAHFSRMTIPIIETSILTVEECLDTYNRLAYGGTSHNPSEKLEFIQQP